MNKNVDRTQLAEKNGTYAFYLFTDLITFKL